MDPSKRSGPSNSSRAGRSAHSDLDALLAAMRLGAGGPSSSRVPPPPPVPQALRTDALHDGNPLMLQFQMAQHYGVDESTSIGGYVSPSGNHSPSAYSDLDDFLNAMQLGAGGASSSRVPPPLPPQQRYATPPVPQALRTDAHHDGNLLVKQFQMAQQLWPQAQHYGVDESYSIGGYVSPSGNPSPSVLSDLDAVLDTMRPEGASSSRVSSPPQSQEQRHATPPVQAFLQQTPRPGTRHDGHPLMQQVWPQAQQYGWGENSLSTGYVPRGTHSRTPSASQQLDAMDPRKRSAPNDSFRPAPPASDLDVMWRSHPSSSRQQQQLLQQRYATPTSPLAPPGTLPGVHPAMHQLQMTQQFGPQSQRYAGSEISSSGGYVSTIGAAAYPSTLSARAIPYQPVAASHSSPLTASSSASTSQYHPGGASSMQDDDDSRLLLSAPPGTIQVDASPIHQNLKSTLDELVLTVFPEFSARVARLLEEGGEQMIPTMLAWVKHCVQMLMDKREGHALLFSALLTLCERRYDVLVPLLSLFFSGTFRYEDSKYVLSASIDGMFECWSALVCVSTFFVNARGGELQAFEEFVLRHASKLAVGRHSNYFLQLVLESGGAELRQRLVELLMKDMVNLSKHRFGSYVVQACFRNTGSPALLQRVLWAFLELDKTQLGDLVQGYSSFFVVRKLLFASTALFPNQALTLVKRIRQLPAAILEQPILESHDANKMTKSVKKLISRQLEAD